MFDAVNLSGDGLQFVLRCGHCNHEKREAVNPALNPRPFSFISHCSGCGYSVNPDFTFITGVHASFQRALLLTKKKPPTSGRIVGGTEVGDEATGSPEYSANNKNIRADAEFKLQPDSWNLALKNIQEI